VIEKWSPSKITLFEGQLKKTMEGLFQQPDRKEREVKNISRGSKLLLLPDK
jgi:hypothetical protein